MPLLSLNGADVLILVNTSNGQVASLDIELDSFQIIASNYKDYIDAMYFVFSTKQYSFVEIGSILEFNEGVWKKLDTQFEIKSAWS